MYGMETSKTELTELMSSIVRSATVTLDEHARCIYQMLSNDGLSLDMHIKGREPHGNHFHSCIPCTDSCLVAENCLI